MLLFATLLCIGLRVISCEEEKITQQPPHIIFILADDLGWNDVSFHGSPQIPTPNIDALAASGIILNNHYTSPQCASSRATLLTGRLPSTGIQNLIIASETPTALPLEFQIMPQYFRNKGYMNHMIGKWNLGYSKIDYTPMNRGFDSFFGFYNEQIDYYDYTYYEKAKDSNTSPFYGIDLQNGTETVKNFRGRYATDVFSEKAVEIISNHDESKPLFLYMAHLAPHTGNSYMPLQAPQSYVAKNAHIHDPKRRIYAGVVSALDVSVGKLVEALSKRGWLEKTIIVFTSDNGGETDKYGNRQGSNFPLRGKKFDLFEGGIRVPCFVWSPLLKLKEPRTSTQLMYISDWLPTLYAAMGGSTSDLGQIDGWNMWQALADNLPSPRNEILHGTDPLTGTSALRLGDYKLITGSANSVTDTWYGPSGFEDMQPPPSMDDWVFIKDNTVKQILEDSDLWLAKTPDLWRANTTVRCNTPPSNKVKCDPKMESCLFNVAADPCEYNNLAKRYPRIVRSMMVRLRSYNATAFDPLSTARDPQADPRCHGFAYVPWLDEEDASYCPFS